MIDQTRAIDNKRLIKKVGVAPADTILKIRLNLKIILDLD
jgi:mRNA interferase MazF